MNQSKIKVFTIPNCITLLNLFAGCLAILYAFHGNLLYASVLIFIAGIFDFFDGLAARLLNSYSELGKQLDSLADVISFGVAPAAIFFQLYLLTIQKKNPDFLLSNATFQEMSLLLSSFIITAFSALRLAKFNIDTRQSDLFIGVPTPANAFLIASIPLLMNQYPISQDFIFSIYILLPLSVILSILLISELPLLSLKFKKLSFIDNKYRYILIILSLIMIILMKFAAYPAIFIIYILLSVISKPKPQ